MNLKLDDTIDMVTKTLLLVFALGLFAFFVVMMYSIGKQQGTLSCSERVPREYHWPTIEPCDSELWDCIRRKDI